MISHIFFHLKHKFTLILLFSVLLSSNVAAQFPGVELINKQHVELIEAEKEKIDAIRETYMNSDPSELSNPEIISILHIPFNTDSNWTKPYALEIYNRLEVMTDEEQYEAALQSAHYFRKWKKQDTCRQLLDHTLRCAYTLKDNEKIAMAWLKRAMFYRFNNHDSTFANIDKAISFAKKTNNRCLKAMIYNRKGGNKLQTGYFAEAEKLLLLAADSLSGCDHVEGMNDYRSKYILGLNYFTWGKYQQALHWFERTLQEHDKDMYISDFWNIYEIMGNVYISLEEYDKAEEMHKRVMELRVFRGEYQNEDPAYNKGIAFSLNNLAEIYLQTGNIDTALNYAQRSFTIKEHPKSRSTTYERSTSSYNIAKAYLLMGNTDSALYYNRITKNYIRNSARKYYLFRALAQEAEIMLAAGDIDRAVETADKALDMAHETTVINDIKNTLKVHSEVMESAGMHKKALESYKHYNVIRDSIISEKNKNEIASLKIAHEAEKNRQVISSQKEKIEISRQNNRLTIVVFSLFIVLIALVLLMTIRSRKKKIEILTKENQLIALENTVFQKELEKRNGELICHIKNIVEKENLIKNLNTRIKTLRDLDENNNKQYSEAINDIASHISGNGWEEFEILMKESYPGFLDALRKTHPNLTNNEWRLCVLLRLNLTTKQIARIMHITPASVNVARSRIRKKMNLDKSTNLVQYITEVS